MNRTELIESVASATGLDKKQAEAAVSAFVDTVIVETKRGEKVSIFGFGIFTPKSRAARTGRNPQTGAPVKIAASKTVGFTPASAYKTTLNTRGAAKKVVAKKVVAKTTVAKTTVAKKVAATKATPVKKTAAVKKVATTAKKAPAKVATKAPAKTTKKR